MVKKLNLLLKNLISKQNIKKSKLDDSGSTIVMVLVLFIFLSVLVAIIMSSVVVNYNMRSIDRKTKDEFYYAEKALNDIYAGMGENCARALGDAYNNVMADYKENGTTGSYQDEEEAYKNFCKRYMTTLFNPAATNYGLDLLKSDKSDLINKLNGYIVTKRAKVVSIGNINFYKKDRTTSVPAADLTDADKYYNIKYTVIKDVKIESDPLTASANATGYVSAITTDIILETPQVDFFTVNERSLDFAVAANKGIEFNGNATINGNVYGGSRSTDTINNPSNTSIKLMTQNSDYGGIFVNGSTVNIDGEYVISGGDIYVDCVGSKMGNLTISHDKKNEIWCDNITVSGKNTSSGSYPKVNINGDVYAQGDLQVEGKYSDIKIRGSYYGYNKGDYKSKSDKLTDEDGRILQSDSNKQSSVIVNATNAKVDMKNLDTLVLLGKAYINHQTRYAGDTNHIFSAVSGNTLSSNGIDLGESVALKTSQEMFLVPPEFLRGASNPQIYDTGNFDFNVNKSKMQSNADGKKWFGWDYLDPSEPTRTVKVQQNGINRAYCYLNFKGSDEATRNENQRNYVEKIINSTKASSAGEASPSPYFLKQRLSVLNKAQDSEVMIGNINTRIYSNGAVVQYDTSKPEFERVNVRVNTADFKRYSGYGNGMHYKYQTLCTYLDPMKNRTLYDGAVKNVAYNDLESDDLPFSKLFWKDKIDEITQGGSVHSNKDDDLDKSSGTVIIAYGNNGDVFYDSAPAGKTVADTNAVDVCEIVSEAFGNSLPASANAFIIIDGDAYVDKTLNINGFIYVSGELIVTDTGTLNVTYNSTILDRRIEGELIKLRNEYFDKKETVSSPHDLYENTWLISYILNLKTPDESTEISPQGSSVDEDNRKYRIDKDGRQVVYDVTSDYKQFMYFDNWRKGQ